MSYYKPPKPDYDKYSTKQLLAIPIIMLTIAISILLLWTVMTGLPVDRGMEFIGGTEVRIDVSDDVSDPRAEIQSTFDSEINSISSIPATDEYIVTFTQGTTTPEEVENQVSSNEKLTINELSQISPSLGEDSQIIALQGLMISFILMSIFVLYHFKSIIPSFIVVFSAISNITVSLAAMNIAGIPLTMGTVGALLMLIGYSVDSDILLNTYTLKERKIPFLESVHEAMRTGITMTVTSLSAMVVMATLATLFGIALLADMGFVLAVGLSTDLIITYLMNIAILRWYLKRKGDYI